MSNIIILTRTSNLDQSSLRNLLSHFQFMLELYLPGKFILGLQMTKQILVVVLVDVLQ